MGIFGYLIGWQENSLTRFTFSTLAQKGMSRAEVATRLARGEKVSIANLKDLGKPIRGSSRRFHIKNLRVKEAIRKQFGSSKGWYKQYLKVRGSDGTIYEIHRNVGPGGPIFDQKVKRILN